MLEYRLQCLGCKAELDGSRWMWRHEPCGQPLTVKYTLTGDFKDYVDAGHGVKRYHRLLPVRVEDLPRIPIGGTPIVEVAIKGVRVYYKLEYLNPSGSFKDRGAAVSVAKAVEYGLRDIVVDSSGNSAIAFSLYGSVAGLKVHVYVPSDAPPGKISILRLLGADLHLVGGGRENVNREAIGASERGTSAYVGHWWNPYFIEGVKTIAYESQEQSGPFDYAVAPVGSGTLILGLYKGFKDLHMLGAGKMPRLIGVQACGYSQICQEIRKVECDEKSTLADGIRIEKPPRKSEILDAIRSTEGTCVTLNDDAIRDSWSQLLKAGFLVEPTSATAHAAILKLIVDGEIERGSKVLMPLTGSGLKHAISS